MATIRVTIGPAVDALQRVAGIALGENVTANYPAWQKQDGGEWVGVDLEQATHCVWDDHRFTATEIALAAAVDADPARVPLDVAGLDRDDIIALYATEIAAALEAANQPGNV